MSFRHFQRQEDGQGFLEYVLIFLLVFVVVIAVLALTRETWADLFLSLMRRGRP